MQSSEFKRKNSSQDFDLTVDFDKEHLDRNKEILDKLIVGTTVDVTGYVSSTGLKKYNHQWDRNAVKTEEEDKVPNLVAFNIEIKDQPKVKHDSSKHAHVTKNSRYKKPKI
jgi:hypothetical protein